MKKLLHPFIIITAVMACNSNTPDASTVTPVQNQRLHLLDFRLSIVIRMTPAFIQKDWNFTMVYYLKVRALALQTPKGKSRPTLLHLGLRT